jgi:dGTPase
VDLLENDGAGLNLAYEVRMGILGHTGDYVPETLEGQIVRISDRIAYVNHDIDDAIRAGIMSADDIPKSISMVLGNNHAQRINTLVCDIIATSRDSDYIVLSPAVEQALLELRNFLFEKVYRNPPDSSGCNSDNCYNRFSSGSGQEDQRQWRYRNQVYA